MRRTACFDAADNWLFRFGTPGVNEHCLFMKEIGDGIALRKRILANLETGTSFDHFWVCFSLPSPCHEFRTACLPSTSQAQRKQLLRVVVCGGGPTGVEVAAEIADFLKDDVPRLFGQSVADDMEVAIIQSADHVLNSFDLSISKCVAAFPTVLL